LSADQSWIACSTLAPTTFPWMTLRGELPAVLIPYRFGRGATPAASVPT
jgi:hypothetical protein